MPIHFRNTPIHEPLIFDSIGNQWNQERVVRPKGYPHYHYLLTEQGQGRIEIQSRRYLLGEGEGVLIAPFIHHSYYNVTSEWLTSFATFTGTIESSIAKILNDRSVVLTGKEHGTQIRALIARIIEKYQNPPIDTKAVSIDCYCLLMNFADGAYALNLRNEPLYIRYVEPVIKEMETHYQTELTVQQLSRRVYITPQYLARLFARFLGCSPYEYLTAYRITKAKELLLTSPEMEVQKIADRVGFQDASHFIAMFKKTAGVTPLEFRKLN